jgi:hypothetical protein
LKIRATGFAGRSSAKPEPASRHFLSWEIRVIRVIWGSLDDRVFCWPFKGLC